jgi:hypothetical protein
MHRWLYFAVLVAVIVLIAAAPSPAMAPGGEEAFLGKWDITVPNTNGTVRACWLDIQREGGELKARFLDGSGSPTPLKQISIQNGELSFEKMRGKPPEQVKVVFRARVVNGRLEGTETTGQQKPRPWTGVRPPVWPKEAPKRKPGMPVVLFNGKDVSGWLGQSPNRPLGWVVENGILLNPNPPANNIYSEKKFMDFKVEVEFNLDPHSNSGVYLRGRHEVQIQDDYGNQDINEGTQGAIYGFIAPAVNACKPAGDWQTIEATIIANRVTVILNGRKIIDNAVVPALTGGALDANEREPGPILLQGDHGTVRFRKVVVTPLI